jgi:hypothetical protein
MAQDPIGDVAKSTGHSGKYANPRPNISSLSRALLSRVEQANNLLGALAKDDVFAGRMCLQFLDPGLGGLQVSNDFNPCEIHGTYLLQNVERSFHGDSILFQNSLSLPCARKSL